MALTYCVWYGLLSIAQNYIWCAERTRIGAIPYAVGLAVNIVLNLALIPSWGLLGAVVATTTSTALAIAVLYGINRSAGMELQRGLVWLTIAPATLCGGAWCGTAMLLAIAVALPFSRSLITQPERELLAERFLMYLTTWQTYWADRRGARHAT
jgi:polysaccharide transporter, PST family